MPLERRAPLVAPLVLDSVSVVRVDAARLQTGAALRSSEQQAAYERAVREYVAVQEYNADRADARTNLGTFYAEQGDLSRAEAELRAAIRLDPFFPPAYANLADVFRAAGQRGMAMQSRFFERGFHAPDTRTSPRAGAGTRPPAPARRSSGRVSASRSAGSRQHAIRLRVRGRVELSRQRQSVDHRARSRARA